MLGYYGGGGGASTSQCMYGGGGERCSSCIGVLVTTNDLNLYIGGSSYTAGCSTTPVVTTGSSGYTNTVILPGIDNVKAAA